MHEAMARRRRVVTNRITVGAVPLELGKSFHPFSGNPLSYSVAGGTVRYMALVLCSSPVWVSASPPCPLCSFYVSCTYPLRLLAEILELNIDCRENFVRPQFLLTSFDQRTGAGGGDFMREEIATVRVAAILPAQPDQSRLASICRHSGWNLQLAPRLRDAGMLINELTIGVVITDCGLPDGTWRDVLQELQQRVREPPLIVTCRLADERLWVEVLNAGGYDVLTTPLQGTEMIRSISLAWRHWRDKWFLSQASPRARALPSSSGARGSGARDIS